MRFLGAAGGGRREAEEAFHVVSIVRNEIRLDRIQRVAAGHERVVVRASVGRYLPLFDPLVQQVTGAVQKDIVHAVFSSVQFLVHVEQADHEIPDEGSGVHYHWDAFVIRRLIQLAVQRGRTRRQGRSVDWRIIGPAGQQAIPAFVQLSALEPWQFVEQTIDERGNNAHTDMVLGQFLEAGVVVADQETLDGGFRFQGHYEFPVSGFAPSGRNWIGVRVPFSNISNNWATGPWKG
jgi:hypothetical protein